MTVPGIPEPQPPVPPEWASVRPGEVLIGTRDDPCRPNHVRSGFRVEAVLDVGLRVRYVHECHLYQQPWVLTWEQLKAFRLLPPGTQFPLF